MYKYVTYIGTDQRELKIRVHNNGTETGLSHHITVSSERIACACACACIFALSGCLAVCLLSISHILRAADELTSAVCYFHQSSPQALYIIHVASCLLHLQSISLAYPLRKPVLGHGVTMNIFRILGKHCCSLRSSCCPPRLTRPSCPNR